MIRFVGAFLSIAVLATPVFAQDEDSSTATQPSASRAQSDIVFLSNDLEQGAFSFEYGVPATPALAIIGASGDAIPTTTNLQKFALSILQASETTGGGAAAGIDFSPYWDMHDTMSLERYSEENAGWRRRLLRGRVSAAFTEGGEADNAPSRASVEVATSLFDSSDPAMIEASEDVPLYSACILQQVNSGGALHSSFDAWESADANVDHVRGLGGSAQEIADAEHRRDEAFDALNAAYAKPASDCRDRTVNAARRGRAWDVGAAFQWAGEPGSLDNMEPAGGALWTTFTTGRGNEFVSLNSSEDSDDGNFRAVAHLRLDFDAIGRTASNVEVEYDRQTVAVAVERLGPGNMFSLQASYRNSDGPSGTEFDGESWQYVLRGDFRARDWLGGALGENVWLSVAIGAIDGDSMEEDTYTSVALRFKTPERAPVIGSSWRTRE